MPIVFASQTANPWVAVLLSNFILIFIIAGSADPPALLLICWRRVLSRHYGL
jgi:hypothetical protein